MTATYEALDAVIARMLRDATRSADAARAFLASCAASGLRPPDAVRPPDADGEFCLKWEVIGRKGSAVLLVHPSRLAPGSVACTEGRGEARGMAFVEALEWLRVKLAGEGDADAVRDL